MGLGLWDIAQIVVPIAVGVVGTPAAGAAAAAVMQGAETKSKGGSWGDAAKGAALAGGTAYLGGAAGGALAGAGGAAGTAGNAAASQAAEAATKETFKSTLGKGIGKALTDSATGEAGQQAFSLGLEKGVSEGSKSLVGNEIGKTLSRELAANAGDAAAKQRFSEHLLKFGKASSDKYSEEEEENAQLEAMLQQANADYMEKTRKSMAYTAPEPWHSPRRY